MERCRCRCGWDGTGEHLCHRCREAIGSQRFHAYPTALSGMQMKFAAYETWGCDVCWAWYKAQFDETEPKEQGNCG